MSNQEKQILKLLRKVDKELKKFDKEYGKV